MSIKLMTEIWDKANADGSKLLLLLALADMANEAGYCWPSYSWLASKTRRSRTYVIRMIKELIDEGYIVKEKRFIEGEQTSNGYYVKLPDKQKPIESEKEEGVVNPSTPPSVPQLTPLVNCSTPPQLTPVNPNHHLTINESPLKQEQKAENVFSVYEHEIGQLTPTVLDKIKDAENEYPPDWIPEAIRLAAEYNRRSWAYAEGILKNWKAKGKSNGKKPDAGAPEIR